MHQNEDTSRAKVHLKLGIAMELRIRRVGLGQKNGGGNSEGESRPQKYQSMTSEGKLAAGAAPWAKQFRDDIEALREFDEGDEYSFMNIRETGEKSAHLGGTHGLKLYVRQ